MAMNTSIQAAAESKAAAKSSGKPQNIMQFIESKKDEIAKALPASDATRFMRCVLSAINTTPHLKGCTLQSLYGAMMTSAQLGLMPNTPQELCFLIPRKNNKRGGIYECTFQMGYKGYIELAYRSNKVSVIDAQTVYENDKLDVEFGYEPKLKQIPCTTGSRGNAVSYWAMFITTYGEKRVVFDTKEDMDAFARRKSDSYNKGAWQTDFDAMAEKTLLKRLLKTAPLSSEVSLAIKSDGGVRNMNSAPESVEETLDMPVIYADDDDYTVEDTEKNTDSIKKNEYTEEERAKREAFSEQLRGMDPFGGES